MGNTGMDRFSCRRKLRRLDAEVAMLASQAAGAGPAPRRAARVSRLERGYKTACFRARYEGRNEGVLD